MALISFPINKKTMILLLFISILSFIENIFPIFLELIMPFEIGLIDYSSQILIGLPFLVEYLYIKNKKYKIFSQFSKLDYIIFILMMILELLQLTINVIVDDTLIFASNTFNRYNIDIILLQILSKFTSNSGYFIHHVIGQIIFYIPSLMIDIYRIYNNVEDLNFNWKHIIIIILDFILNDIILTYKKYLMEIKFIPPFIVCFLFGLINLIYLLLFFSLTLINRNPICFENKCFDIFDFDTGRFENNFILAFSIICSIFLDCIFFFLYYHIFNLFTTSHTIFNFSIYVMVLNVIEAKDNNLGLRGWLILSLAFILVFIGIFIYLEIIELNFCDLNKNTRIKIAERAREPKIERIFSEEFPEIELYQKIYNEQEENNEKTIEIAPGYIIHI